MQAEPEDSPPEEQAEPAQQAEPADSPQEEVAEAVPGGLLPGSPNLVEHSVRLTPQRGFPSSQFLPFRQSTGSTTWLRLAVPII